MLHANPIWTRKDLLLVIFLTVAGAVLRIIGLDEGLWIDEIQTLRRYVRLPVAEIVASYNSRNNHILYSLAAHYSVSWFGESAWALRLPAALAGIATIPAAYYLGRQVASRNEAFLACALLAVSYHHVWFSQNARGYTGLLLGAVLLSSLFIRLMSGDRTGYRTVLAYALIAALASWIHLTAALVVMAHGIIWLLAISPAAGKQKIDFKWPPLLALVLAGLLSLVLYIPVLTTLAAIILPAATVPTVPPTSAGDTAGPVDQLPWRTFEWLLSELWTAMRSAVPGGWPVILLAALAMIAGVLGYLTQGILPAAVLMLPPLLTFAVLHPFFSFFPRFLFGSAFFFLLIAVRGGFVLSRTMLPILSARQVTLLGLVIVLAAAAKLPRAWNPKQDFAGVAEFITTQRSPDDAVVCGPNTFYLRSHLGMDCQSAVKTSELTVLEQTHARTWFLYTLPLRFQFKNQALWEKVQSDYALVTIFRGTVGDGDIMVMLNAAKDPGMDRIGTDGREPDEPR